MQVLPTSVVLGLGGNDPALVLEDADLDRAAAGLVFGAFFNAGQTCLSTERVYAVESVYEPLVERITRITGGLMAGEEPEAEIHPLVTPQQRRIVARQLREAVAAGATLHTGHGVQAGPGRSNRLSDPLDREEIGGRNPNEVFRQFFQTAKAIFKHFHQTQRISTFFRFTIIKNT